MTFINGLIVRLIAGVIIGVVVMSMMFVARENDREMGKK